MHPCSTTHRQQLAGSRAGPCAQQHRPAWLATPCTATARQRPDSSPKQQQQPRGRGPGGRPAAGPGRRASWPEPRSPSPNTRRQQPGTRQEGGDSSLPQQQHQEQPQQPPQQPPGSDVYIAEPWEVSEPWEDPGVWQELPAAPLPQQQSQQQQREEGRVRHRVAAGGQAAQASPLGSSDLQDSLDWLLDEDEDDEEEDSEAEAGWLLDEPGSDTTQQQQQQLPVLSQPQPAPLLLQQQQQDLSPPPAAPADLQASWEAALAVSLELLASYDVRYDVTRPARISSSSGGATRGRRPARSQQQQQGGAGLGPDEVSLTAAAMAAARAAGQRRRRSSQQAPLAPLLQTEPQQQQQQALQAAQGAGSTQQQQQQQQQQWAVPQQQGGSMLELQQQVAALPDDARWQAVCRAHASYLAYMQQLAGMVVNKQQQQHQLVYQVGISDAWLQVSHLLAVFGGRELTPPVVGAMWKRLAAIINRKVFVRMSHAERCHYDAFIERLVAQSITTLHHYGSSGSSSSSSSGGRGGGGASSASSPVLPAHLAAVAYGMAVLGARSEALAAAVVEASAPLLLPAAESDAAAAAAGGAAAGGAGVAGWGAGEVASLVWGLGTVGHMPPEEWLQQVQEVSKELLPRCQPAQLWGLLWGFAQLGSPRPDEPWLASWLAAAQQQLDGFNAEGLAHAIWALAALGHVPHKLWLRAYCGMVAYKIKSFVAGQLAMVLPALSTLGYKPRPELRRTIISQVRRNLHTYSPSQLVAVVAAVAAYPPGEGEPASTSGWQPGRMFLYDFITHSAPPAVMTAWSGRQAAQVLWAFSRFRYVPDRSYLLALTAHLQAQLPLCDGEALSMSLWALAALRQPLPSAQWGAQWCAAALAVGDGFGPQALAHGLAGMAALRVQPPVELMQSLTRAASGCLSSFSCMELGLMVAALADLHWRPSDAWMEAFVSQVSQQLPAFENEDYGLLLFGLASLAQPLHPALLGRFCREAGRKLYGLSGEGLGLLVWGLAQYEFEVPDAEAWWGELYAECGSKWGSAGLRGCALMALGLAQMGPRHAPPGEWESDWVQRYRALAAAKPQSWEELVVGFRAAAGLEAAEALPSCPWLCGLLLRLGMSWNLQGAVQQQGIAGVAGLIEGLNVRLAASAALQSGAVGAWVAAGGGGSGEQLGQGGEDVQPMSATAVLL